VGHWVRLHAEGTVPFVGPSAIDTATVSGAGGHTAPASITSFKSKDALTPHNAHTTLPIDLVTRCKVTQLPVVSPLRTAGWHRHLRGHPNPDWAHRLVHDIIFGVDIGYSGSRKANVTSPNFTYSEAEDQAVSADIANEVRLNRMAGPFSAPPFPH
jgi:hypothetical protein